MIRNVDQIEAWLKEGAALFDELEKQRIANLSPKRRAQEGKRQLKKAIGRCDIRGNAAGTEYIELCNAESIAKAYGIEMPIYYKWLLMLHRAAQATG